MGRAIFISYRREDAEGEAGRLFDDLTRAYGDSSVFMDVAGINPGADFRKAIDDNVASCGVLLAVIGPTWATVPGASGSPRIDEPNDWVGLEIGSALARNIPVIPVLVHGAAMPHPDQLPDKLKDLAFRNCVELTHARWNSDAQLLIDALKPYVDPRAEPSKAPARVAADRVAANRVAADRQVPAPSAPARIVDLGPRSSVPLVLGIVAAAVLALGVVGYMVFWHHPASPDRNAAPVNPPAPVNSNSPVAPDLSAFAGTWNSSSDEGKRALHRLEIAASGGQLVIHAWAQCKPIDCDWGTQPGTVDNTQQATATWNMTEEPGGRQRTAVVSIKPANGQLSVSVHNTFSDRGPNSRQLTFVKAQ